MSTVHHLAPDDLDVLFAEPVVDPFARHPARLPAPGDPADVVGAEPDPEVALVGERGQTTAEYALVLVGAATIAMLVVAWAGSTSRISALFDAVLRSVQGLLA